MSGGKKTIARSVSKFLQVPPVISELGNLDKDIQATVWFAMMTPEHEAVLEPIGARAFRKLSRKLRNDRSTKSLDRETRSLAPLFLGGCGGTEGTDRMTGCGHALLGFARACDFGVPFRHLMRHFLDLHSRLLQNTGLAVPPLLGDSDEDDEGDDEGDDDEDDEDDDHEEDDDDDDGDDDQYQVPLMSLLHGLLLIDGHPRTPRHDYAFLLCGLLPEGDRETQAMLEVALPAMRFYHPEIFDSARKMRSFLNVCEEGWSLLSDETTESQLALDLLLAPYGYTKEQMAEEEKKL